MAGGGQISLLVDSPLRTVNLAFRGLDADVRKQITRNLKPVADIAWKEETRGQATSRLQSRVLAGTSRVGASGLSVSLMSGGRGRLSTGTPTALLSGPVEYGTNPNKPVTVRNKKGTTFQRRNGTRFLPPRRGGYVVHRAARLAIPRVASLVVQTAIRTVHELREGLS
jgi:hypothetical protein